MHNNEDLITEIKPPEIVVLSPRGKPYIINEYEWMHLRVQIRKNNIKGWKYQKDNDELIEIDQNGRVSEYPKQFEVMERYLE